MIIDARRRKGLQLLAWICLTQLAACKAEQTQRKLTLERLYSLPRLIGTAPKGVAWASDSQRLAFLWNDKGTNFYDIWTTDVASRKPVRLTHMPKPPAMSSSSDEVASAKQAVPSEQDTGVSEILWHPNARQVLFCFRGDVYLTEAGGDPRQLTATSGEEKQIACSPDGKFVTYVLNGNLWLHELDSDRQAKALRLTNVRSPDVRIERYQWSPDGRTIAVLESDETRVPVRYIPDYLLPETQVAPIRRPYPGEESATRGLGVVDIERRQIRWLNIGGSLLDPISNFAWSPDGGELLIDTSDLYVKDRRLVVVNARTGASRQLYRESNPHHVEVNPHNTNRTSDWWADWGPDGKGVYFLSDLRDDFDIYYVPLSEGAAPLRVTHGQGAVSHFTVSGEMGAVLFLGNKGRPEEQHVFRVGLLGGEPTRVSRRPGTHTPVFSRDGRYAAVLFSSDEVPPDLFLTRADSPAVSDQDEHRITSSPLREFGQYRWVAPQYVTFPSHIDGVTIHGRLLLPQGLDRSRKYPAILGSVYSDTVRNQWGGRTAHPSWGLDQYLLQEGYVILNVDIRGSWGHGKEFREAMRLDYGGIDTEDLYSGVLYLKQLGFVDMKRVGIWGSSYGGLLTCMSLFKKPGVYRAGVAGAPATNVWHAMTYEMRVMMAPQDQAREYDKASANTHAAGLEDHLMIIHGMRDRIVLFKDSVSLVQRLLLLGKDVDFVILPDSQHAWDGGGLYQTRFAYKKLVDHFERYLGKGPT